MRQSRHTFTEGRERDEFLVLLVAERQNREHGHAGAVKLLERSTVRSSLALRAADG